MATIVETSINSWSLQKSSRSFTRQSPSSPGETAFAHRFPHGILPNRFLHIPKSIFYNQLIKISIFRWSCEHSCPARSLSTDAKLQSRIPRFLFEIVRLVRTECSLCQIPAEILLLVGSLHDVNVIPKNLTLKFLV